MLQNWCYLPKYRKYDSKIYWFFKELLKPDYIRLIKNKVKPPKLIDNKTLLILVDLYYLRFKQGDPWYELTDYLKNKLEEDGILISYTKDDVHCFIGKHFVTISIKKIINKEQSLISSPLSKKYFDFYYRNKI